MSVLDYYLNLYARLNNAVITINHRGLLSYRVIGFGLPPPKKKKKSKYNKIWLWDDSEKIPNITKRS